MDFPWSAVVQRLVRAFVAVELEVSHESLLTIGSLGSFDFLNQRL